ncbi:MAG TPA: hypothetical protein QF800_01580 [Phycisphaerales bacterium]|nr:hypothetical protein [Phycisphaerales bacterium]
MILNIQFLSVPRVPFQHRMRLESLDRDLVVPEASYKRMTRWRGVLFGWVLRNASFMPDMLELPPRRTIEIGMRVNL